MRILVFSDTHLTDKFNQKEFDFLTRIIDECDQVVINGDFWDGYIIDFDSFVKSEWSKLFSKLRKKKATYLYGNHDRKDFMDQRVNLFSESQQHDLILKTKHKELLIEHGNKYLPFIDEHMKRSMIPKSFAKHALDFEGFLVRGFGTGLIGKMYQTYNRRMKNNIVQKTKDNQVVVCGHTHLAEIDLEKRFINSGMINYGIGQYLIIEKDEIVDKEVWYDAPILEETLDPSIYFDQTEFIAPKDLV